MADVIRIKRRVSGSPGAPSSLANAELAYNEVDHILYYGEGTGGSGGTASVVAAIGGQGLASNANPIVNGTAAPGTHGLWARDDHVHPTDTTRAPLNNPVFTGVPQAPNATPATAVTAQIATTAFVWNAIQAARIDQLLAPNVDVSWGSHRITSLLDPSNPQDAATKNYVDITIQGMTPKPTAALATAAALPANTYSNGTSGVGATLTATANGALNVDGVAVPANAIVLVKNEAAGANNGLYVCTNSGSGSAAYVLTRHVDMDQSGEFSGAFIPVGAGGTVNANTLWLANPSLPVTVGSTIIPFTQLNSATSYTPGNGINISANVISAVGTTNRISVSGSGIDIDAAYAGQSTITTVGNIALGTWNGTTISVNRGGTGAANLTAGYAKANGSSPFTSVASIPSTDISGLGTMATQNASAVAITGGTIDGVTLDGGTF
jgi:hypothetical protein